MFIVIFWGIATATLLLIAGYLIGVRTGNQARENLREELRNQKDAKIDTLLQQSNALQHVIEPLTEWEIKVEKIQSDIELMQASMVSHDSVALKLNNLETETHHRSDLTQLMDEIAEKAHFKAILLSDENGLPLVSNHGAVDLERLAAIASFVLLFGERINSDKDCEPTSFLVREAKNKDILSRIFLVGKQRLVLTAVSLELQLTPNALDPALEKITRILE